MKKEISSGKAFRYYGSSTRKDSAREEDVKEIGNAPLQNMEREKESTRIRRKGSDI